VHFLGFSAEKKFGPGEISPSTIYCANPHIFPTAESAQEAFAAWPLRGGGTLNF